VDRARSGGGPTLLDCRTWRHWGHFIGDAAGYRDPEEHAAWLKRDPLIIAGDQLCSGKWATKDDLDRIRAEAEKEMQEAIEFGRKSPFPAVEELFTQVYTD
jgi:pyruvate dehydrogenase E1 component alpha subunit